jgi:hypothetical protein
MVRAIVDGSSPMNVSSGAEELAVELVDGVVGAADVERQVGVLADERVERPVQHGAHEVRHQRQVDHRLRLRLDRRLGVELERALRDVRRHVADALEVGRDLERGRDEAEVARRGLVQREQLETRSSISTSYRFTV